MAWDKKHYKETKKFMQWRLNHVPWCCQCKDPVEYARAFLPMIDDSIQIEDYEAAQAICDAMREFFQQFSVEPIPADATLKL